MGLYSRLIFPRLCDLALGTAVIAELREQLLANVVGEVLEIGFGTGLNLPHYPRDIRTITVVDPNPGMSRRAQARIEQSSIEVDQRLLSGEQLPFDDESFDSVVSTFTLCSIHNVSRALSEMCRVLRPGGRFLFLEHGLSPDLAVQKWQRRFNWLQTQVADNCHLDRDIQRLIADQPFAKLDISQFYLEQTPRTHGFLYHGTAVK